MIAYVATTALLAAGSVSAGDTISVPFRTLLQSASGSASSDNHGEHYTHTSEPQHGKKHYTSSSSITCKASASTKGWSKAKDAHADAVAEAFKYACSNDIDENWAADIQHIFDSDYGYAVAKVWADAKAECEGYQSATGRVQGCAAAYASASRWATFTATAYADSWADAFNYCHCNAKEQVEGAYAYGTAEEMKELTASVSAEAEARACVEGTGSASAHVESHCLQKIYANVFAKAIAEAVIKGKCYTKLKADAYAHAEAVIDVWEDTHCDSHASSY